MYRIAFLGPAAGVKPYIVLASLLENNGLVDWDQSLIITESSDRNTPFLDLIKAHSLNHIQIRDRSLESDWKAISNCGSEFLISCGWGARIGPAALAAPTIAAINCHSSYLPDYKGADIYLHYWANCEDWMGATVHYMTEKFDDGRIIVQQKDRILPGDTPDLILRRISELTAALVPESLHLAKSGYQGTPQTGGRYFYKIKGRKIRFYRWYNVLAKKTNLPRRLTPHKTL